MDSERPDSPDPAEVEPTDNSSGTPVDLERLEDLQQETATGSDA
jgi:hypothetical protein